MECQLTGLSPGKQQTHNSYNDLGEQLDLIDNCINLLSIVITKNGEINQSISLSPPQKNGLGRNQSKEISQHIAQIESTFYTVFQDLGKLDQLKSETPQEKSISQKKRRIESESLENTARVILRYEQLYKEREQSADLLINIQGQRIGAHQHVLALQSPYFSRLIEAAKGSDDNLKEISLQSYTLTPNIMDILILFLYKNEVVFKSFEEGLDVFLCASECEIEAFNEWFILNTLNENLCLSNALSILELPKMQLCPIVEEAVLKWICCNAYACLFYASPEQLGQLSTESIIKILQHEALCLHEPDVAQLFLNWLRIQTERDEKEKGPSAELSPLYMKAFSHVRWALMERDTLLKYWKGILILDRLPLFTGKDNRDVHLYCKKNIREDTSKRLFSTMQFNRFPIPISLGHPTKWDISNQIRSVMYGDGCACISTIEVDLQGDCWFQCLTDSQLSDKPEFLLFKLNLKAGDISRNVLIPIQISHKSFKQLILHGSELKELLTTLNIGNQALEVSIAFERQLSSEVFM